MKNVFEQALQLRKGFYHILKTMPKEELLEIPTGFNNNIWWNIAHIVVTQQILVYKLSGVPMEIPQEFVDKFKKGTTPDGTATDEEIESVKKLLFTTVEKTMEDYDAGLFKNFKKYPTSAGVTLKSVDESISFNQFHEGLHMGSVFALRRAVKL
ncbi:DinB family protein [Maribacter algarum]|uniref:DinB family protein n=1 Tax=Maribacter algarum (ex Zhang et al. 2020) TaxID=2578118 RepID=A0A5S3PWF9_9FLAO|nr:DinB family protein [Maribacter algarum]TMM59228.1 DinB family protein [Maribacter algarum]